MGCELPHLQFRMFINIYVLTMDQHIGDLEEAFLKTLDEKEFMAYSIAKRHLGTLFSLDKSNAYLEWLQKQKEGGGEK